MNKNVKFLGAAAAALLTVAPIAAPVVSSVANVTFAAGTADQAHTIKVTVPAANVDISEQTKNYIGDATFPVTTDKGTIAGVSAVVLAGPSGTMTSTDKFAKGVTYTQTANVTLSGLEKSTLYTINDNDYTTDATGVIKVPVTRELLGIDKTANGNPFFRYNGVQVYGNLVPLDSTTTSPNVVNGLVVASANTKAAVNTALTNLTSQALFKAYADSSATTTAKLSWDIDKDLAAQGIKYNKDNTFTAKTFYITLVATNQNNGNTATVTVLFDGDKADATFPIFRTFTTMVNGTLTPQTLTNGQTAKGYVEVNKGDQYDPTDAKNVQALASSGNATQIKFEVVSNPVNTNMPGIYNTTYKATNSDGKTSIVTVRVRVSNTEFANDSINYKVGYGVNVWALAGTTAARFTGNRLLHGDNIRTWDKTTVNGKEYVRVTGSVDAAGHAINTLEEAQKHNTWVQSQYLNSNKNIVNSEETAWNGVVTVNYKGKGGVALWTKDHKIAGQYVKNGARYKAFATKTMGGKLYYRLGSQRQWIESTYVK